jgi:uncharacterized membrane protein YkvA (DUF1232 family)
MFRLFRLWRLGAREIPLLWFALKHPGRPAWLWPAVVLVAFYALEPFNFAIPMLGAVDELILVPLVLHLLVKMIPAQIRRDFAGKRVFSRA